jgi:hypothetical protein
MLTLRRLTSTVASFKHTFASLHKSLGGASGVHRDRVITDAIPTKTCMGFHRPSRDCGLDIKMTENEWEGDFDPMADPEEQRHILSVLDSFRHGLTNTPLLEAPFTDHGTQVLPQTSSLQRHSCPSPSFLLASAGTLDVAVKAAVLYSRLFLQAG